MKTAFKSIAAGAAAALLTWVAVPASPPPVQPAPTAADIDEAVERAQREADDMAGRKLDAAKLG